MHAVRIPQWRRGFTLVELLVVIVILSILVALVVPTFAGMRATASDAQAGANLVVAYHAAKASFTTHDGYPLTDTLVGEMRTSEPEIKMMTTTPVGASSRTIYANVSSDRIVTLCTQSGSGFFLCLRVDESNLLVDAGVPGHSGSNSYMARSRADNIDDALCALPTEVDPPGPSCGSGVVGWRH